MAVAVFTGSLFTEEALFAGAVFAGAVFAGAVFAGAVFAGAVLVPAPLLRFTSPSPLLAIAPLFERPLFAPAFCCCSAALLALSARAISLADT